MSNPIILWIASLLGVNPGWVIVGVVVVVLFGGLWLMIKMIVDLPFWIAKQRARHTGFMWYFWGTILLISVLLAIVLNMIIVIGFWLAVLGFAGTAYRHVTGHRR
jgi:hypothetical protein